MTIRRAAGPPPRLARPYTLVSGRTRPAAGDLPVEAIVVRTDRGVAALHSLRFERLEILRLTVEPLSIAEIAALLRVPLGVARVLVDDLAGDRLVELTLPHGGTPTIDLLERVLHGLERI